MLVKCWVPEELQERLWDHTRRVREEKALEMRRIEFEQLAAERQRQRNRGVLRLGVAVEPGRRKSLRGKSPGVRWF